MSQMFDSLSTLEDLLGLIQSGTRESEVLEYKTASRGFSDREKAEIAKDVSAMANSLGGVIVYGVATKPDDKTLPSKIVPIHVGNIETFDRVVNAQVRPVIAGIRRKLIPPQEPQVMVVEVPPSEDPPHQSLSDKRYYRRSGCENLPMEHDLVALKFGRKLNAILDLHIQPLSSPTNFSGEPPWTNEFDLRFLLQNSGRRLARYFQVILRFPSAELIKVTDVMMTTTNIDRLYPGQQARQFIESSGVIHSGVTTSVIELRLSLSKLYMTKPDQPLIQWSVFADEMDARSGVARIEDFAWNQLPTGDG